MDVFFSVSPHAYTYFKLSLLHEMIYLALLFKRLFDHCVQPFDFLLNHLNEILKFGNTEW